jgi:tRNA-2-methylthio-N6-dimethylallyladenosine synthase
LIDTDKPVLMRIRKAKRKKRKKGKKGKRKKMTYFMETYGCQMNKAESAALVLTLHERGWTAAEAGEAADMVLINTCVVRATAETRAWGRIAHYVALKKKRTFTLIVAGCMASQQGTIPGVDFALGTTEQGVFPALLESIEQADTFAADAEKPAFSFSPSHLEEGRCRSFVPIMHGCNNFCTYCIVPYVRGAEVSRAPAAIVQEVHLLAEKGVKEICLLGQNVNSYRWTDGTDFPALLSLIAGEVAGTPIHWIRFLSANPKDFSPETITVMAAHPVFCRHVHLCLQHGSDRILSAMNRRYTREQYCSLVDALRSALPGVTLSTDILIGFPGETEEDVALTLDIMDRVRFINAFMYHYNPREGTAAFDLADRVPEPVKRERLGRVIALQKQHTTQYLQGRIGQRATVLIEGIAARNAGELQCRTAQDEMVVVPGAAALIGSFGELTLSSLRGNTFRSGSVELVL